MVNGSLYYRGQVRSVQEWMIGVAEDMVRGSLGDVIGPLA
jgi:hypothetical protein